MEGGNGRLLLEMTNPPFFCTMRSISSRVVRVLQPLRISPRRWEYILRMFGLVSAADRPRSGWPGHYFVTEAKHQMSPLMRGLSGDQFNFVGVISGEFNSAAHRPPMGINIAGSALSVFPSTSREMLFVILPGTNLKKRAP